MTVGAGLEVDLGVEVGLGSRLREFGPREPKVVESGTLASLLPFAMVLLSCLIALLPCAVALLEIKSLFSLLKAMESYGKFLQK